MRVKSLITLFVASAALLFLDSCSRESPLKENTGLKNNHSRVFASREPFKDPQAFVDSMANTAVNAADSIPDTLTVTVNDTIYLLGILPRFVEKIYLFQWTMIKGKDTVQIDGDNAEPFAWAYSRPGVYYPQFVAFDGNNATDTAGSGTKKLYVNVIDSKPQLSVPKDTLWTKHEGDVNFRIFAADSFGTIKNVKIDMDASGKSEPKVWDFEEEEDSLLISVGYNKKYVDSLGNQTIYVIVEDDDGNEVMDSVNLHFNKPPTLKIISPLDGSRHDIKERFYFFYEGKDEDNPQDLRYYIRAYSTKNGKPREAALTSKDLIAKDILSEIYEPTTADGRNVITLVDSPSVEIKGRVYWDMYVTDGYDIVRMERIKTDENDSIGRDWNFYLGDLSTTLGVVTGTAKYQERDKHAGIRVEFNNGNKVFTGFTNDKGRYTITVDPGSYEVRASSDTIREYQYAFHYDLYVEAGDTLPVPELILADTTSPTLVVKDFDTLDVRKVDLWSIYAKDLASRIDSVSVKLDDDKQDVTCDNVEGGTIFNCRISLDNLEDGDHVLSITAKDKAGNTNTKNDTIYVRATKLALDVNGVQKDKIGKSSGELLFTATISNDYPTADSVTWNWEIEGKTGSAKVKVVDGKATYTMTYNDIAQNFDDPDDPSHAEKDYIMTATYKNNGADVSSSVTFGVLGEKPTVAFQEPGNNVQVTKNDPVHFKIATFKGASGNAIVSIVWNCGTHVAAGYTCPANGSTEGTIAFDDFGEQVVTVTVKDDSGNDGYDTGYDNITVMVVHDTPTIAASTDDKSNEYKINTTVKVNLTASDKQGKVQEIKYGCSNGKITHDQVIAITPAASVDATVNIKLPGEPTSNFRCEFKAIDDDEEEGIAALTFVTLLDPPEVRLNTKADSVKINSDQKLIATATDKLGKIEKYELACGEDIKHMPDWTTMSKADTVIRMPAYATDVYCIVQVTDDDKNTARDTATYTVLVGAPEVTASAEYKVVTILDEVEVNAHAYDPLGSIVKYEWGCGSKSTQNIPFKYSSTTTPKTTMTMPKTAEDHYLCIIKVTDDDNNEARDTVEFQVLQGMPTIEVSQKFLRIRASMRILLNATANDNNGAGSASDPGSIVEKSWSCGLPEQISSNWKVVSDYSTDWMAPKETNNRFICVARAKDNDGNIVTDTMTFAFTTQVPNIHVVDNLIYINIGDEFTLDATVNDAWQGINWFSWECVDSETGKTMESKVGKYDYEKNDKTLAVTKVSSYSEKGKNMYCIVSAEEASSTEIFKDTTEVRIMRNYPVGAISAADTVHLWSGDGDVPMESKSFYTSEWGGFCSKRGELSLSTSPQWFRWNFSNIDDNFYDGNDDGSMDTTVLEFYNAFMRPTVEGSMVIKLDYRDSTMDKPTHAFNLKHKAEEVSRTVYFRKAWQNLSKDTVVENASSDVPVAFTLVGNKPVIAYLYGKNTVKAKAYSGSSWADIDNFSTTDSIVNVQIATNGKDIFVGALTKSKEFTVKKSAGATSAFANVGTTMANVIDPKLLCNGSGNVLFTYINNADRKSAFVAYLNGSAWTTKSLIKTVNQKNLIFSEMDAIINKDGNLIVVAVDSAASTGYAAMFNSSYGQAIAPNAIKSDPSAKLDSIKSISLAVENSKLYLAYMNRNSSTYGTSFRMATIGGNSFSWGNRTAIFDEAYLSYSTSIAVRDGVVYIAICDNDRTTLAQINVFRYENGTWHYHGENQLPYFIKPFYDANGYYLRGNAPTLLFDGEGKLHLSMLARTNGKAANKKYNGPIVMKYVADNWKVTPTKCEEK